MTYWRHLGLALVLFLLCVGCDDGGSSSTTSGKVRPLLDAEVLAQPAERFFDFPFPSDLRTLEGGQPDLTGFPNREKIQLLKNALSIVEEERSGFSAIGAVYFRFDGALDPASLPNDPATTLEPDSTVFFIDVDPDSSERGQRFPAYVHFEAEATSFWPGNTLVVRPIAGHHMRVARRYAVVIRSGLLDVEGAPVQQAAALAELRGGGSTGDTEVDAHYQELLTTLEAVGVPGEEVLVATAFETSDPVSELDALREAIYAGPESTATNWEKEEPQGAPYVIYRGVFTTTEFFSGTSPYTQSFGTGRFQFDADGKPLNGNPGVPVRFTITVPNTPMPAEGYPIVIYGHGTGGGAETHVGGNSEGAWLATAGAATLGFDAALHGDRVEGASVSESILVTNVVAARELARQTVVDMMVLYRFWNTGLEIPASVTGGDPIRFNTDLGLYMGHSQGSQEAGLLLAIEPQIDAAFLSAGGAVALISVMEREAQGAPISCAVALFINVPCAELNQEHPVLNLIMQPLLDPADPIHFARRFIQEPAPGHKAKHIAMTEGNQDKFTPPESIEALAAAIGLPIVEPFVQSSAPLDLTGLGTVAPPLTQNLTGGDGTQVTGGLMQWGGEGHFAIYDISDARIRYVQFFKTAIENGGVPTIVGP